jgi:hypothetical protein
LVADELLLTFQVVLHTADPGILLVYKLTRKEIVWHHLVVSDARNKSYLSGGIYAATVNKIHGEDHDITSVGLDLEVLELLDDALWNLVLFRFEIVGATAFFSFDL